MPERQDKLKNLDDTKTQNWLDLASHFQAKVLKRTSEVAFLHTKAGFLIAAAVIELQAISELPKFTNNLMIYGMLVAATLAFTSLVISITSMNISRSATPLNPDDMILGLTERPKMSRSDFANWLAKSYAAANKEFNSKYSRKYNQQIISASLLVASFVIIVILKGIHTYV
tara:strand:+ start:287 stop:799 length:513 start_codon:yes stop_codon:yes gene_type:complete